MGVEAPNMGESYGNHVENMSSFLGFEFKNLNSGKIYVVSLDHWDVHGSLKRLKCCFFFPWFLVGFYTWIQGISP